MHVDRLSLNSMTVPGLSLPQLAQTCAAHGIGWVAPWRALLEPLGAAASGCLLADAGLSVSSLCRGGMFTASSRSARTDAFDDNRRAVDEANELGADLLVLVCGPVVDRDVAGSAAMVRDGLEKLLPHARAAGVTLGVEPLHPMMAADRSVVARVADAADMLANLGDPEGLSVVVDAYHVWWDLHLADDLARVAGRIRGLHVSDWVSPLSGALTAGRGMMGEGHIDLPALVAQVEATGYDGPIEVEVLSEWWWDRPPAEVVSTVVTRFEDCV